MEIEGKERIRQIEEVAAIFYIYMCVCVCVLLCLKQIAGREMLYPGSSAWRCYDLERMDWWKGSRGDQFSSVQLFSCVQLSVTPRTAARQACLSITNSQSLLQLISIKLVMPSSLLILCCPLLLLPPIPPSIRVFTRGGQSTGVSGSAAVLPVTSLD